MESNSLPEGFSRAQKSERLLILAVDPSKGAAMRPREMGGEGA